jgi:phosphoribosylformylglycinamidine synthase II
MHKRFSVTMPTEKMRIELRYKPQFPDGRAAQLLRAAEAFLRLPLKAISIIDTFIIDGIEKLKTADLAEIFQDTVAQDMYIDTPACQKTSGCNWNYLIEISYKPGVTDPVALTARDALKNWLEKPLPAGAQIQTAVQYLIQSPLLSEHDLKRLAYYLYNPLIQNGHIITKNEWLQGKRPPGTSSLTSAQSDTNIHSYDLYSMSDKELLDLSKKRLLALTLEEMQAVRDYFNSKQLHKQRSTCGLSAKITDVELEMIAQTWSEHCKHKIFNATIHYRENGKSETIKSLFISYIKHTTDLVSQYKHYLKSVFHDNSGVIEFDEQTLICFKVETHNSPSALDPYGGAITGIVGVNRDILGTGKMAKPIFNTNVLCFADPETLPQDVPEGFLHPKQIMEGVHHGIIDGGNQSGIPVVAGGFLFDESYIGKPLVFCGTGGILPYTINGEGAWIKHIDAGDCAVMVGGRVGKDGVHGATFSSLALDEGSPTSAVQIGDPITQKKMWDFLLEARDKALFKGITDNGAGGLSSSLGEMASFCNGVRIELDKCPLKYPGLAPWEILVSESQERMSLAVGKDKLEEFLALARKREVEATVVGTFTDSGYVEILSNEQTVGLLDISFLHHGLPVMHLEAEWDPPFIKNQNISALNLKDTLLCILADPNVSSKENLVRQYDHEVQGCSIIKPFVGVHADSHSDGAVFKPRYDSYRGITITHGICPRYGDIDTYHMAMCAVDEALRAHVALGGDPDFTSALDNFCWPDPVSSPDNPDGKKKLAQLVRAAKGLKDACTAYGIPLISGKDSMKNDAYSRGKKISVRPTLLISLMGIIPDIRKAITTDFKQPGDIIYVVGETRAECGGTLLEKISRKKLGMCSHVEPDRALPLYRALYRAHKEGLIRSCHDLSDGGLAVSVVESALGGRLGCTLSLNELPGRHLKKEDSIRLLFSETPSRFLITVKPEDVGSFQHLLSGFSFAALGKVDGSDEIQIKRNGKKILNIRLSEAMNTWKGKLS